MFGFRTFTVIVKAPFVTTSNILRADLARGKVKVGFLDTFMSLDRIDKNIYIKRSRLLRDYRLIKHTHGRKKVPMVKYLTPIYVYSCFQILDENDW